MTHECGHWIFHRDMFTYNENQLTLFSEPKDPSIPCRAVDIEVGKRGLSSDNDWMEHHAKYFSAALLMPRKAVKALRDGSVTHIINRFYTVDKRNEVLAWYVSKAFQVSQTSAQIRIRQLGLDIKPTQRLFFSVNDLPSRFELIQDM